MAATNFIPYNPDTVITGNPTQWFNPNMFHMQPMVPCPNHAELTCGTLGDAARGILRGPALAEWDFSIVKNTRIHESHSLQFRFEAFNFANHPNWNTPSSDSKTASTFGKITSARTMREMQFGLKYAF